MMVYLSLFYFLDEKMCLVFFYIYHGMIYYYTFITTRIKICYMMAYLSLYQLSVKSLMNAGVRGRSTSIFTSARPTPTTPSFSLSLNLSSDAHPRRGAQYAGLGELHKMEVLAVLGD